MFDSLRYKFNNLQEIDEVIKNMRRKFDIDFSQYLSISRIRVKLKNALHI